MYFSKGGIKGLCASRAFSCLLFSRPRSQLILLYYTPCDFLVVVQLEIFREQIKRHIDTTDKMTNSTFFIKAKKINYEAIEVNFLMIILVRNLNLMIRFKFSI